MRELKEKQETECVFYYSNALHCIRTLTKQSSDRGKEGIEQLLWIMNWGVVELFVMDGTI